MNQMVFHEKMINSIKQIYSEIMNKNENWPRLQSFYLHFTDGEF